MDVCESRGLQPPDVVAQWLDAGIRLVQLRAKRLAFGPFLELAEGLSTACRQAGAVFIVNDRVDVARLAEAAGVHLGQDDVAPADARRLMPAERWIGLSTHSQTQVVAGLASVATYLAIGPVFSTPTKTRPDPVIGLDGVRRAAALARQAGRPLVAIGGIDSRNAPDVLAAGADSVAVISGLLDGGDVAGRARAFLRALESPRSDG